MTANSELPDISANPVLFIRIDRIGDLVLTLAADSAFNKSTESSPVDWWIAPGTGFIADHAVPRRRIREMKPEIKYDAFKQLLREVKARSYKTVVIFHAPWWVSVLVWLAGIPNRIGVKSQWHTFIFLNKGIRQKRSLSEMSEYEYNLRLVEHGLELGDGFLSREPLRIAIDSAWQSETLSDHGLKFRKYSVVHPGMSGSAKNWPNSHYISWIQEAAKLEQVVITGTAGDEPILEPIRQALAGNGNIVWLNKKLSGPMLLHILDGARIVLAPSTGIIHLAASLGRPAIGIYSPVRVQHPRRWGPLGSKVHVLVPEVDCPGKKACVGTQCAQYDCMNRVSLEAVRALWTTKEI